MTASLAHRPTRSTSARFQEPEAPLRHDPSERSALVHETGNGALDAAFFAGADGAVLTAEWALEEAGLAGGDANSNQARLGRMAAAQVVSGDGARGAASVAEAALELVSASHGHRLPLDVVRRLSAVLDCGPSPAVLERVLGSARMHTGAQAGEAAQMLGARAFAVGTDVAFAPGLFRPGTPEGDELIAHELVHVVQFVEGRLPDGPDGGVSVSSPSDAHEREAVAVASAARAQLHDDPVLDCIVADIAKGLGVTVPEVVEGAPTHSSDMVTGADGAVEAPPRDVEADLAEAGEQTAATPSALDQQADAQASDRAALAAKADAIQDSVAGPLDRR